MLYLLSEPKEILETHQWLDRSVGERPNSTSPLQDLSDQFTSVFTDLERPSQLRVCRQNRPCWRRERSLSWKFQYGRYLPLKSTHSWKTLTLPKHLDRMGYRLQSSRTVPPSSPGRLRRSSIPRSKLGTFLNSSGHHSSRIQEWG